MKTPHKHAALIKAWADGAKVQVLTSHDWRDCLTPLWFTDDEYRIKPEPKPDLVYYCGHSNAGRLHLELFGTQRHTATDNLKLTFDGETLKLKSAEVL